MYEQIEKPKDSKSRAVASSTAQRQDNRTQGFSFVDNRPESVAQKKTQAIPRNSPMHNIPVPKKTNNTGLPENNSQVLQQVHNYKSSHLKKIAKSTGPLGHRRSRTAYGYTRNLRGRNGPHTTAHIKTSVMLEALNEAALPVLALMNSRLIPRPKQARNQLRKLVKKDTATSHATKRVRRDAYMKRYKKLHIKALSGDKRAIAMLIEFAPYQTRSHHQDASSADMAGKGENRSAAAEELDGGGAGSSLDANGMTGKELKKVKKRDADFELATAGTALAPDSESELDTDDDN